MKNKRTAIIQSIIAIAFATILPAFNSNVFADCGQNHDQIADLVEVADHAGQFKTLLAAATAVGLVDTLKSEGPFTLFAPTDKAFAKLPEGTVEGLLADIPKLKDYMEDFVKELVDHDKAKELLNTRIEEWLKAKHINFSS